MVHLNSGGVYLTILDIFAISVTLFESQILYSIVIISEYFDFLFLI